MGPDGERPEGEGEGSSSAKDARISARGFHAAAERGPPL